MKIFDRHFYLILSGIILIEILSLMGHISNDLNIAVFFIIVALAVIISVYDLRYGVLAAFSELFIGSMGYLFVCNIGGINLSIRMGIWLAVMSVWLGKFIIETYRTKKINLPLVRTSSHVFIVVLFVFILWGVINGYLAHNQISFLISDAKRWLYFLLIIPAFEVLNNQNNLALFKKVFTICVFWLSIKTLLLLYMFSHDFSFLLEIYKWVRDSGVGEVTLIKSGFYRIFFQSHIFVLIGFFYFCMDYISSLRSKEKKWVIPFSNMLLQVLLVSSILVSFSRSFWIGFTAGYILLLIIIIVYLKFNFREILKLAAFHVIIFILSLILIFSIIKFPFPFSHAEFNANILTDRASQVENEAAVSSRWSLLPVLWKEIIKHPILGAGYGSIVTYKSSDPRVLSMNSQGLFTTYTFEWGWLEIWLKLGLLGMSAYLIIFYFYISAFARKALSASTMSSIIPFSLGLFILTIVNFFTPYLNHPLGIGMLIYSAGIIDYYSNSNSSSL